MGRYQDPTRDAIQNINDRMTDHIQNTENQSEVEQLLIDAIQAFHLGAFDQSAAICFNITRRSVFGFIPGFKDQEISIISLYSIMASSFKAQGNFRYALQTLEEADNYLVHHASGFNADRQEARTAILTEIGSCLRSQGRLDEALAALFLAKSLIEEARQTFTGRISKVTEVRVNVAIGNALHQKQDIDRAISFYEEADQIINWDNFDEVPFQDLMVLSANYANALYSMGSIEKALELVSKCLSVGLEMGAEMALAELGAVAHAKMLQGNFLAIVRS